MKVEVRDQPEAIPVALCCTRLFRVTGVGVDGPTYDTHSKVGDILIRFGTLWLNLTNPDAKSITLFSNDANYCVSGVPVKSVTLTDE